MDFEIIWTENARNDLKLIVDYLKEEWSSSVAEKFSTNCLERIELIKHYPFIGVASEKEKSVRRI